ncbi:MAG TPA: hypothetical protein VGC35_07885 [Allosphingosinicella sp.]|jgi:hypothetical protein
MRISTLPGRFALAIAVASAALAAPAAAQPREYGFAEIAADLAYGFCPLFLAAQFPLTSPQLAERGFGTAIMTEPHPQFGEVKLVMMKRTEGDIAFGGASGKLCTVIVRGSGRSAALARLRETMSYTGLDFKPVPTPAVPGGVAVQAFKAATEGQFLNVQLIEGPESEPVSVMQMFATNE